MEQNIIIDSFDKCGLTSSDPTHYHRQLRHFIENNEFVDDLIDFNDGTELDAFINDDSKTSNMEEDDEAMDMSVENDHGEDND